MANQKESKPDNLSPEWNKYVMGLFQANELIDGNPLTAGLRRVAELLIGEIISSKPTDVKLIQTTDPIGRAVVTYEVQFLVKNGDKEYIKTYADVSDVWAGNTDDLFAVHGPATASTKAEGRALRKALKIRAVAAEELCKKDVSKILSEQSGQTEQRTTPEQIMGLDNLCRKLDIDVMAFVNSGSKQYRSIYEVTRDTASKMVKELGKFTNDASLIKPEYKNYKDDWSNAL